MRHPGEIVPDQGDIVVVEIGHEQRGGQVSHQVQIQIRGLPPGFDEFAHPSLLVPENVAERFDDGHDARIVRHGEPGVGFCGVGGERGAAFLLSVDDAAHDADGGVFVRNDDFRHLVGGGLQADFHVLFGAARNGSPLRFVADVAEQEFGGQFGQGYFEVAVRIGDGSPIRSFDANVGGRQGFPGLRVQDSSADDMLGLLGLGLDRGRRSTEERDKKQFAEHGTTGWRERKGNAGMYERKPPRLQKSSAEAKADAVIRFVEAAREKHAQEACDSI